VADILEIDLPNGDILELDIPEGSDDVFINNAIKEATTTPLQPGEPVTFGELPEGDTGKSPVDIKGESTFADDDISEISAAFGPLSSKLQAEEPQDLTLTPAAEDGDGLPILEVTGATADQESFKRGLLLVSDMSSLSERALAVAIIPSCFVSRRAEN